MYYEDVHVLQHDLRGLHVEEHKLSEQVAGLNCWIGVLVCQ